MPWPSRPHPHSPTDRFRHVGHPHQAASRTSRPRHHWPWCSSKPAVYGDMGADQLACRQYEEESPLTTGRFLHTHWLLNRPGATATRDSNYMASPHGRLPCASAGDISQAYLIAQKRQPLARALSRGIVSKDSVACGHVGQGDENWASGSDMGGGKARPLHSKTHFEHESGT
eukprot:431131-Hanusia_phi.AAC.2